MKQTTKLILCILLCAAPIVYLAIIWKDLPAIVPTHFNAAGEANDFSPKGMLWAIIGGLAVITIGLYVLLNNLHHIDPKRYGAGPSKAFAKLANGLVLFLTAINFSVLLASSEHNTKIIPVLVGLLLAFIGNVMYSLKPNFFAGIRVPWTLADDSNWRATHRIAGILWFIGGIMLAVLALVFQGNYMNVMIPAVLVATTVIPAVYSFWFFKRSSQSGNRN